MITLLDEIIPEYDVASRHSTGIAASPSTVYRAARTADLGRGWLVRLLMGMRSVPALALVALRGQHVVPGRATGRHTVGAARFTLIDERPGEEFVLGIMGRFWRPTGGVVPASAERLRQLPEAGLAQGIWNFRVEPHGSGTLLSTETRVRCGDDATRRHFLAYWRVIRPASGTIRRSMLRQIRRSAEIESKGRDMHHSVTDELIALAHEWDRAMIANDAGAIGRYMADDWAIIGSDGRVGDKATFLGLVRSGALSHDVMETHDLSVRVYGDIAVTLAQGISGGKYEGQPFREIERASCVFVRQDGRWRCVLTHLSRLAGSDA